MKEKYHFHSNDFEFPVVLTKYAIEHSWRPTLVSNPDLLILDLKKTYGIFQEFIPPGYIKPEEVKYVTQNLLLQIANAYKWIDDDNLYALLMDFANKLRKKSLGGVISVGMTSTEVRSELGEEEELGPLSKIFQTWAEAQLFAVKTNSNVLGFQSYESSALK